MAQATAQAGRIEIVDPKKLIIGTNVRIDTKLKKDFVDSIREHGVLEPITVQQLPEGFEVIDGQRRTLAALEAGTKTVPIYVRGQLLPDDARLVEQVVVNAQREDLTRAERVGAVQQLTLFGLEAGEIVKRLGIPKVDVERSVAIAASPQVLEQLVAHVDLDLEQAAALVEFQDDKKVFAALTEKAGGNNFDYAVREARRAASLKKSKAELKEKLNAEGTTIVNEGVAGYNQPGALLESLVDATGKKITPAKHKVCPGHAAYISAGYYEEKATIRYVCTDYATNGHTKEQHGGRVETPEELKARQEREQAAREREERERIATELRLEFVTQLLQRDIGKLADVDAFIARAALSRAARVGAYYGTDPRMKAAAAYLQVDVEKDTTDALAAALAARPQLARPIMLAIAIATYANIVTNYDAASLGAPEYFEQLAAWGHKLSDVENEQIERWKSGAEGDDDEDFDEDEFDDEETDAEGDD